MPGDHRNPTWLRVDFALDKALQIMVPVQNARALQLDRGHRHVVRDVYEPSPLSDLGQDRAAAMKTLACLLALASRI